MSWIYGYIRKQADFTPTPVLRESLAEFRSPGVDVFAGGSRQTLVSFPHPADNAKTVFILGNPILLVGEEYRYPQPGDWTELLADEERLRAMDGHWLVLIAGPDGITAWNDSLSKRSLFIHEDAKRIFFTSDLQLLKQVCRPELDLPSFGAYWHSVFPPLIAGARFAPTQSSYYKDVQMLGTAGKAVLSATGCKLSLRLWNPDPEPRKLPQLLQNMTLLPLRAGKRVVLGLSGGMDIRPLLAICLAAQAEIRAVHLGADDTADYRIAKDMSAAFHIPFSFISHADSGNSWEQSVQYLSSRGFGFNPANNDFMGYYPKLAEDNEVYISGFFGEIFRFRFLMAYLQTLLKPGKLGLQDLARIIYKEPASFFTAEANRLLQQGFWHSLRESEEQMPPSRTMPHPLWMHLFFLRYGLRSINLPSLAWIDQHLIDHMPYLQSSIISQHWHYGFVRQLNEGLHRSVVRAQFPALEKFPLALADVSAPYSYRQIAMKLKMWAHYRRTPLPQFSRTDAYLQAYRAQILELRHSSRIAQDPAIDKARLDGILQAYYAGDSSLGSALLSFVSYALGK